MADTFFMHRMRLNTPALFELGRMLRLPINRVDYNYLVHCALSELFQKQAPQPFSIENNGQASESSSSDGRSLYVLAYSELNTDQLQEIAKGFASPAVYNICEWNHCLAKPMPEEFPKGKEFQFETQVCPVVRKSTEGPRWHKGQELDAFLSHVWEVNDPDVKVSREEVYKDWLSRQIERRGGANAVSLTMNRFGIRRMARRKHDANRKTQIIQRPDVSFTGTLKVTDSNDFKHLLRNGLGRHRSFGFGMLKIRRT